MSASPVAPSSPSVQRSASTQNEEQNQENIVVKVAKGALFSVGALRKNSFALMKAFRLVTCTILAIDYRSGVSSDWLKLFGKFDTTNRMVNSFLCCDQVDYLLTGAKNDWNEGRYWSLLGNASFTVVSIELVLSLLNGVGILSLANWGAQMKGIPFVGKVITRISFNTSISVGVGVGFLSLVADELNVPPNASVSQDKKWNDWIRIAWFTSEIADEILTMGGASFPFLTGIKVVAACLGIGSHCFDHWLKTEEEKRNDPLITGKYDPLLLERG